MFLRLRLPRSFSLWVGDEAPLLSVSLHRNKEGVTLHLALVCMLLMVGAARRSPDTQPVTIV